MSDGKHLVSIRLETEVYEKIIAASKADHRSITQYVKLLIVKAMSDSQEGQERQG